MRPSTLKKQKKIIETATTLFFEHGYSQTSLDQIIEQCGGSKQTLYRYFGDKKGILVEVITHCTEEIEAAFQFDSASDTPLEEKLNQFGYEYLKALCSPKLLNVYRIIIAESRHDKELATFFLSRGPQHMHHLLVDYLQSQVNQGRLKLEDTNMACSQFLGALKGDFFHEALVGIDIPDEQNMKQHVAEAVKIFLRGSVA